MIENNGKVNLDFNAIKEAGYKDSAAIFSENCKSLQEALEGLWNKGLYTFACCKGKSEAGHKSGTLKSPYVSIIIDEDNKSEVFKFVRYLLSLKDKNKPNITFFTTSIGGEYRFSVKLDKMVGTNRSCDKMFEVIAQSLSKYQSDEDIKLSNKTNNILKLCENLKEAVPTPPYSEIFIKIPHNNANNFSVGKRNGLKLQHCHSKNFDKASDYIADSCISTAEAENYNIRPCRIIKPTPAQKITSSEIAQSEYYKKQQIQQELIKQMKHKENFSLSHANTAQSSSADFENGID